MVALGAGSRGCGPGGCSEKTGSWEHLEGSIPDALGVGEVDRERGSKEEAMTFGPGQDKVRVSVHADGGDGEKHFWGEGGSLGLDLLGVRYITVSIMQMARAPEVTEGRGLGTEGFRLAGWLLSLSWGQFEGP